MEAGHLTARLRALGPKEIYHVADAWFADASWSPLDSPRGSRLFELDDGTPLVVVVQTAGVAWRTDDQGDPDELEDIEIRVDAGATTVRWLVRRDGRFAVSETWTLDLPTTTDPLDVTVELRANHRSEGGLALARNALASTYRPGSVLCRR